jgi:inhibitor of KinA
MNNTPIPYRIFPLGDSAITIDFGNSINKVINKEVMTRFSQLQQQPLPGTIELVPAYSSLTIYYDLPAVKKRAAADISVFDWMKGQLEEKLRTYVQEEINSERIVTIPVCYEKEFSPDIEQLAALKNISVEEIIQIHTSSSYKVYMLGFLPGFAYMGEVDEKIAIPRKPQPQNVAAGSVGIAGKQTGIYPLVSPGGWQIIGRTPLKLFNPDKEIPTLLQSGDIVQFYSISKDEFKSY